MAKTPRAAMTRIAATVTARYYPSSGATDGFYLDGRISGRREHRAADITLDREERGFFYSVFAHLSGSGADDAALGRVRKSLDRILGEVHQPGRNIDTEINELAECAVSVAGRITLQHDGVRQPYFAGIMVKDSELAAVTMGGGCAYLYRGDVLYPLTADDYPLDAIDYNGKPVAGLDVYCAGVAGTVRYSNIAQLQLDDCIIVCNKEIMDALGQREVLRMLFEAEDQADAAGLIMTAASVKLPGVPLQFLIGFVETITAADRTGRLNLGRIQQEAAPAAFTGAGAASAGRSAAAQAQAQPAAGSTGGFAAVAPPTLADSGSTGEEDAGAADEDYLAIPGRRTAAAGSEPAGVSRRRQDELYDEEDDFGDEPDSGGRGRRIAFYVVIAAICIGCLFAIWNMLFAGKGDTKVTTTALTTTVQTTTASLTEATTAEPSATTSETGVTSESSSETSQTTTASQGQLPTKYTVASGDSLYAIAKKFYGSGGQKYVDLIMQANSLTSIDLQPGQVLDIPAKP